MNIESTEHRTLVLKLNGYSHCLTVPEAHALILRLQEMIGNNWAARVKRVVAESYGFSVTRLESKERTDRLCLARWICFKLMRDRGMSSTEIGDAFNKDHGTVLSGLNTLQDRMELKEPLRREIELLRQRVGI